MTMTAPLDVPSELRNRLRRGQTPDQLVKVGVRTGWWSEDDVDAVVAEATPGDEDHLAELEKDLADRNVIVPPSVAAAPPPSAERPASSPRPGPQPPAAIYEAIAGWAEDDEAAPRVEPPVEAPAKKATVAVIGADADAAVARFLAERTVPAGDEQFITGPDLREAYEDWFGRAGAPALTTRQFGVALTARYRKKQASTRNTDGVKPVCYFGLAWKPAVLANETPTEGTAPGTIGADAAGTAPELPGSGHGIAGPDAQPQVSPSRSHSGEGGELGASDAPAELAPVRTPAEIRAQVDAMAPRVLEDGSINAEFVAIELTLRAQHDHPGYIADLDGPGKFRPALVPGVGCWPPLDVRPPEATGSAVVEASDPVEKTDTPQLNLLAVGLDHPDHPDRRVRSAARAVERAVDALCTALGRVSRQ